LEQSVKTRMPGALLLFLSLPAAAELKAFSVVALPATGIAPLNVMFEIRQHERAGEISRTTIDLDGDGKSDITRTGDDRFIAGRFGAAGVFNAQVKIVTTEGAVFDITVPVNVMDRAQVDAEIQKVWSALRAAFVAGDGEAALALFTAEAVGRYRPALTAPGTDWQELAADLGPIHPGEVGATYADYVITRKVNGENEAFLITFMRGRDGAWRISSL
jgi:hypothetical protein